MSAPILLTSTPKNDGGGNLRNTSIVFELFSDDGVDPATLNVFVEGVKAIDGGVFQSGYTGSINASLGGNKQTVTIATHPNFNRYIADVYVDVSSVGPVVQADLSFSFNVDLGVVADLVARSYPEGKRIDLSWTNPPTVTRVKIRRSAIGYPRFTDDSGEDIYEGTPITEFVDGAYVGSLQTTNKALEEDKFYYYTVFIATNASSPYDWLHHLKAEAQGLSIKDYFSLEGDYVYELLPREVRRLDGESTRGVNRYKMRDYCRGVIQPAINLYRGWIESLLHFRDPDLMPLGRLGDTSNNYGIIGSHLWDFGLPAGLSLDAATMRRLALTLISLYQQKGTCAGAVFLAKQVTGWDVVCHEAVDPICGIQRYAQFWDGESFINHYLPDDASANPTLSFGSLIIKNANIFEADKSTNASLSSTPPYPSFIIDGVGTFACVDDVSVDETDTTINLKSAGAILRKEITGTGTGALNQFTVETVDAATFPWQFPNGTFSAPAWGANAWVGKKLMDSAGTIFAITESVETVAGDTVLVVSGTPANGAYSLAADFDPSGATYATRKPLFQARIFTGEFTLTYDPIWDVRLRDETLIGPWVVITTFSSTLAESWAPTPQDVVLVSEEGDEDTGKATSVTSNTLSDSSKTWTDDEWRGFYLLPDWNQHRVFRIISNTDKKLVVDLPPGVAGLHTLAMPRSYYVIMTEQNAIRYVNLMNMLPSFLPGS